MNRSAANSQLAIAFTFLILALAASACSILTDTSGTQDTEALYTAAAQTYVARLTLEAGGTAIARLTELARTPSLPASTPTSTLEPSATALLPTPPSPSPTSTPPLCDWAEFVGDVTTPDDTRFPPGADFTKVWRIRNIGSCAWSADYDLIFTGGEAMSASRSLPLPGVIRPGETVDLEVDLRAPAAPGVYRGDWMLRNPAGGLFGIAANAREAFWVQIQVAQVGRADQYAYDFVASYCVADWSNGSDRLSCPGAPEDRQGFITLLDRPELETRVENEPALWTRPAPGRAGWIIGEYPPYRVKSGDHFLAEIGCLYDSPGCSLLFQLDYRTTNGVVRNLGAWRESYDSVTTGIDIDLSALEGASVQFILSVSNLGIAQDANAFWFVPQVRNFVEIDKVVLTWKQYQGELCNEVEVYLSSRKSGAADAFSCLAGGKYLGNTTLRPDEVGQLVAYYDRLRSFDAEIYSAATSDVSYLTFSGGGKSDAVSVDIDLLEVLAMSLFERITR